MSLRKVGLELTCELNEIFLTIARSPVITAHGPTLWNSLPEQLWQPNITFGQFKRSLKTFMFG